LEALLRFHAGNRVKHGIVNVSTAQQCRCGSHLTETVCLAAGMMYSAS
jgi:hypothetical protein